MEKADLDLNRRLHETRSCIALGAHVHMMGTALLSSLSDPMTRSSLAEAVGRAEEGLLPPSLQEEGLVPTAESIDSSISLANNAVASVCSTLSGSLQGILTKQGALAGTPYAAPDGTTVTWGTVTPCPVSLMPGGVFTMFAPAPSGGSPDTDGDGLSDLEEREEGTDPLDIDSDGDGLTDSEEVRVTGTNPCGGDTDGDGRSDGYDPAPTVPFEDNPFYDENGDMDGDGLSDRLERALGTSISLRDTDGDGLSDGQEVALGTNPLLEDTDGDGAPDLPDRAPLDPTIGQSGIDKDDDEELFIAIYGTIAVGAAVGSLFGCASCSGIALKAAYEAVCLYQRELEERRTGTDD